MYTDNANAISSIRFTKKQIKIDSIMQFDIRYLFRFVHVT